MDPGRQIETFQGMLIDAAKTNYRYHNTEDKALLRPPKEDGFVNFPAAVIFTTRRSPSYPVTGPATRDRRGTPLA